MNGRSFLIPAICILSSAALAASQSPNAVPGGTINERYQRALEALDDNRSHEDQTREERDRLAAEAAALQQRLVDTAAKVQELETSYAETQAELERMDGNVRTLEADLVRDRARVVQLIAVLQRLDSDEPPALVIRPADSLGAARSAMLLGSMLPPVYGQAAALAKRLSALGKAREDLTAQAATAKTQAESLKTARDDLDHLLQLRNQETADAESRLTELHGLTEEMGRTANDLKTLMDRIATLRSEGGLSRGMTVVTPEKATTADIRRGSLRAPVVGKVSAGDPAGPGNTPGTTGPSGLWFEGAGGARAVAPGDSEVVFAGPYQKFGQVLILEMMGGYHLTLAGLGRIDVRIGDQVLAGEPVGTLPDGKSAQLYLELRRNGQTVDPTPWMGADVRKAKGT